jgi:hypothetical protein
MSTRIIFYCNYISANLGAPGVYQAAIADITKYTKSGVDVFGSDYKCYYRFKWSGDKEEIEVIEIKETELGDPSLVVFSGFDPYRWTLLKMLSWRRKGCAVAFWTWGYHTKQQSSGNWEHGRVPKWLKRVATEFKKYSLAPMIDYYLVWGKSEIADSRLDPRKCVELPMGRPQSAILKECDDIAANIEEFKNDSINYIGRGRWSAKGIDSIVKYAHSENGKKWQFNFFISSKEEGFNEKIESNKLPNIQWYFDVLGKDNVPWLRSGATFITLNKNPTQIRLAFEALYAGTPIVVCREAFMEGVMEILACEGLEKAVQIVSDTELEEMSFEILPMKASDRMRVMKCMSVVLSAEEFGQWFGSWLKAPSAPASYYDHISKKITAK